MKKGILIFYLLLIGLSFFAQNLVPNPSFETYSICPDNPNQVGRATSWSSYRETPDYYNSCSVFEPVPINDYGYQQAATGNAYAGFLFHGAQGADTVFREYIGAQLSTTLTIGQKYYVSFKANFANIQSICANNKLGILFSTIPYSHTNPAPIRNFAHVYTSAVITDTANWTTISGSVIADSAYKYIIIGNFFDNQHTTTMKLNSTTYPCDSYYFVDDICVSADSTTCDVATGIQRLKNLSDIIIYPNPASNMLNIKGITEKTTIRMYDVVGKLVLEIELENSTEICTSTLTAGVYTLLTDSKTGRTFNKVMLCR